MPDSTKTRRPIRPTEGFSTARLSAHPDRPVRLLLPSDYQPKYAYPLIVLFHPDSGDEDTAARLAPLLSRRNYVVACPRGPVRLGPDANGRRGFGWGDGSRGERYLRGVVKHACREYHVHADRVYCVGIGEGAAIAYRFGLEMLNAAGVVALNGALPQLPNKIAPGVRVFVGHGANNPVVPVSVARKSARLLTAAGADVRFETYPTTHTPGEAMLRAVNNWIMTAVNTDPDQPPRAESL